MRRWIAASCALVLVLPSLAHAEVAARPVRVAHAETDEGRSIRMDPPDEPDTPLAPDGATLWSVGGILAFAAMTVTAHRYDASDAYQVGWIGLAIAPSFGQWYARRFWTKGLTLRTLGALVAYVADERPFHNGRDPIGGDTTTTRNVVFAIGCGLFLAGTIADVATAKGAARDYNRRTFGRTNLVPMVERGGAGLALVGRF